MVTYIYREQERRRNRQLLIVGAGIAALIALAVICLVQSCMDAPQDEGEDGGPVFDAACLIAEGDRYSYIRNGQVISRVGVDVSEHQEYVDWQAVANDGIEFAYIRLGYRGSTQGDLEQDDYYEYNIDAAAAAGLDTGVYFFSQALTTDEAVEEAEYVLNRLAGRQLSCAVVYDFEKIEGDSRVLKLSADDVTANADAFCERIEQAGYSTMIYSSERDLIYYNIDELDGRPIWYASYGGAPATGTKYACWQYSDESDVAGIDSGADMNLDLSAIYE